jgi:uncharacterized protein (UPF0335 family)
MVAKKKAATTADAAEKKATGWGSKKAAPEPEAPAEQTPGPVEEIDPSEVPAFLKEGKEPAGEYDAYNARQPAELPAEPVPAKDADDAQIPGEVTETMEPQAHGGELKRARKAAPAVPDVDLSGDNAGKVLLSYCERIERLAEEAAAIRDDTKEVFAELKGNGFDVATVRKALRRRAMDPAKREEQDSLLEIYETALQNAEGR